MTITTSKYLQLLPGLLAAILVAIGGKILALLLPTVGAATISIFLGIFCGNTFLRGKILNVGTKFAESALLEYSVVLLGFTVTFQTISKIGIAGVVLVLLMMTSVISIAYLLGKKLGFSEKMSLMFAGGNAVCGSSAIGTIAPAIDADEEEMGEAITLVNLLGTILMLALPVIGSFIFGDSLLAKSAIIGATLQSVGQVVASASMISNQAVQFAMLFKILRIMMLVFVVAIFSRKVGKQSVTKTVSGAKTKAKSKIPWYVTGFLIICILNSMFKLPKPISSSAHFISTWFETIALAAIGIRLDFRKFMKQGTKFLLYGLGVGISQIFIVVLLTFALNIN